MKKTYPIVLHKGTTHIIADIPHFNTSTQGNDFQDAIRMAKDAITIMCIDMLMDHEELPDPTDIKEIESQYPDLAVVLVDVEF